MSKTTLIIKREYLTRVTKKSFLITTFLAPILFVGVIAAVIYVGLSDSNKYSVLIEDATGLMSNEVNGEIVPINPDRWKNAEDSSMVYEFTTTPISSEDFLGSSYNLKLSVDDQSLNDPSIPMLYKELPSARTSLSLERKLQDELQEITLHKNYNLTPEQYKKAKVSVNLIEQDAENLDKTDESMRERGYIGYIFAMLIYITIFLFGSQVMRGVIEEKTSRIVEVLISSVKPFQLLMGKIIGVGLVGLTQFVMWIALTVVLILIGVAVVSSSVDLSEVSTQLENGANMTENMDFAAQLESMGLSSKVGSGMDVITSANWPMILGCFLFFFLGGYLLYGSLLAAIGSAVDAEADAQQFMVPVTIPLIAAILISQLVIENPESTAAVFFSIFPLTSPVVMLVRVAMDNFVWWELVLSMVLLVATFIGSVALAGKIYRTGILMHGKKVSYKELWKWLRY